MGSVTGRANCHGDSWEARAYGGAGSDPEVVVVPVELGQLLLGRLEAGVAEREEALEVALAGCARREVQQHGGRLVGHVAEAVQTAGRDVDEVPRAGGDPLL